ncbi:S1C family serine protease [Cohnella caldifontis]|uniref:S1C family serine protease n=1 Tax=Cohnella caldifontis TaxID=3027471 RepID=UPI0023EDC147|nr:trypsin-like peptidase domain-containing protein [Cohnella sp. YIM B05605]
MKRKILFLVLGSFLLTGAASAAAAGLWGAYKGNPVIKVKVDGQDYKTSGVPPVSLNGQVMLPLNVLKQLGINYTYDSKKLTANIEKPDPSKAIDKQSRSALGSLGSVQLSSAGGKVSAFASFTKIKDEDADWDLIFEKFRQLAQMDADTIGIDYVDADGTWIGSVSIDRGAVLDYESGKTADISDRFVVSGHLFKPVLSTKEIGKLQNAVGVVLTYDSDGEPLAQGSGFVVNGNLFITNHHVVEDASKIVVKLDGVTYDVSDWYYFDSEDLDLYGVLLSTSYDSGGAATGTLPAHSLDYTTQVPEIGEKVYAIGSPQGFENTLTEGIVSSIRTYDGVTYIQHTADTDHGSSGGVLLNEKGEAIGVTSMGVDGTSLDFAIPMKYVQRELDQAE